jgi:outer membrane protein assembly factor BamD
MHRVVLALLLGCLAAGPAAGQETYDLTEQGWEARPAPEPGSPAARLQAARRALADEDADRAIALAGEWLEAYPAHPLVPEALLLRGDARVADGRYYQALFDYEQLVGRYPASELFLPTLERELRLAELYLDGDVRRRLLGVPIFPLDGEAEELLIRIQERAPGSDVGQRALLRLGDYYYDENEMGLAAQAYDLFLQNYPRSEHREWAMLRLIQASLARFRGPRFDPTGLVDARQRLVEYQEQFPAAAEQIGADALMRSIGQSMARRDLLLARWYDRRGERVSAVALYRRLVAEHADTASAAEALRRLRELGERP